MTSQTMTAYRFRPQQSKPMVEQVSVPTPALDEVLVKVLAAGVCHSDLTILDTKTVVHSVMNKDGFTLGHEGAGIIVSLGSAVASTTPELTIGTYVAIFGVNPCFKPSCYNCSHGMENYCETTMGYGLGADGLWTTYAAIRASCVVPVPGTPDSIPPGVVSSATDAILTSYHAMKTCCNLQPEHTVLCLGIGGLGLNAISIAKRCLGVQCVVACDTREMALQSAKEAGADYTSTPDTLASVASQNNLMIDFAFDFVGSQSTFDLCFSAIRCGGTIHVVGLAVAELNLAPLRVMQKQLTYKTSYWGAKRELAEILQAIADGLLSPEVEMRPMDEVFQVMDDMYNGKLKSRVALFPPGDHTSSY